MSFDANEIETRFVADVDEQSFNQADQILVRSENNAQKTSRSINSNLRVVGIALGSVEGEAARTADELIRVSSHLASVAKAGPELIGSLKTLPAGVKSAANNITKGGVAVGVALAVTTVAIAHFVNKQRKLAQELEDDLERQFTANELEAKSAEELLDIREQAIAENAILDKNIANANEERIRLQREFNQRRKSVFEGGIGALADAGRTFFNTEAQELVKAQELLARETKKRDDNNAAIEKTTELLAGQNLELDNLEEETGELSDAAKAAADAQQALSDAIKQLEATAKRSAKAARDATKATSAAIADQRKANMESVIAQKKAAQEFLEFELEQVEELADLRQDNRDAQLKAEKDFNKSIDDLVKNQSFLAAIDRQDDFVDQEQERRDAARESIADLRVEFAEERFEKQLAAEEAREDRLKAISEASADVAKAQRNETKLRRKAADDVIRLQRSRAEREIALQSQVNKNVVSMLTSVVKFSADAAKQVNTILSSAQRKALSGLGAGNGAGAAVTRSDVLDILDGVMG